MSEMIAIAAYKVQYPIEAPFAAFSRYLRRRRTVRALRELSVDRLDDIGIDRAQIAKYWKI